MTPNEADHNKKKYMYDKNEKRVPVSTVYNIKASLAMDEITYCLGCVESVVRCATDVNHNLTEVQSDNVIAILEGLSSTLDTQFKQTMEERKKLAKEQEEFDTLRKETDIFNAKYGKFVKLGYALVGAILSLSATIAGFNVF